MLEMAKTQIQIEEETRDKLSSIGKHKETYDDIINRLLEYMEEKEK